MGFIEDELEEVKKLCEHLIPGARLVSCVPAMVRVEIKRTTVKIVTACIQFPVEYPKAVILIELKSKTLSLNLLNKLSSACELEAKKYLGKAQVLKTFQFIRNFLDENPLSCCYDEISALKKLLGQCDELRLKQKSSVVSLKLLELNYFIKAKITVPDNYPQDGVVLQVETNFPIVLDRFVRAQGMEIVRRCVEPPLKAEKGKHPFRPTPSLGPAASHFLSIIRHIPRQTCSICSCPCLPEDPQDVVADENADDHIERNYCGHLFHQKCLLTYMKTPPFQGGKSCPRCGERIYHDKWRVGEKLAEDRWAHQQARQRELDEVQDFFN